MSPAVVTTDALFEARGVEKRFRVPGGVVQAVRGVAFEVRSGEALGIVGESGSGKSTLARAALRLIEPDAGSLVYRPDPAGAAIDLRALDAEGLRRLRPGLQIVFQDPAASLNPRRSVRALLAEPLLVHGRVDLAGLEERLRELCASVRLPPAVLERYPHQLSLGQAQRVALARAVSLAPRLLVLDEPVAALDVLVRAQIVDLLAELFARGRAGGALAGVLVSHDLAVVRRLCARAAVMYAGRIVEEGPAARVLVRPAHPYTQMLVAALPRRSPDEPPGARRAAGEVPSALHPPAGCAFHPRCPLAVERCRREAPALEPVAADGGGGRAACFRLDEAARSG